MSASAKESGAFDLAQWRARIKDEVLPRIGSEPDKLRMQRIATDPALTAVWNNLAARVVPYVRPDASLDAVAYHVVFPPDFSKPPTKKRIKPLIDALRRFQQVAAKDAALANWIPELNEARTKATEALAALEGFDSSRWAGRLEPGKPGGVNAPRNWIALHLRVVVMPALFEGKNHDVIARLINSAYPELAGYMSADDVRKLKIRNTGR